MGCSYREVVLRPTPALMPPHRYYDALIIAHTKKEILLRTVRLGLFING